MPDEKIFNGNVEQQIQLYQKFQQNLEKRENIISESIPPCDPYGPTVVQLWINIYISISCQIFTFPDFFYLSLKPPLKGTFH